MTTRKNMMAFIAMVLFSISAAVYAQGHALHSWQKVSEQAGVNGQKVCTWVCRAVGQGVGGEHYKTTSGMGRCPSP